MASSDDDTLLSPERDTSLDTISVVEWADLLLLALVRRSATGAFVEPDTRDSSVIRFELAAAMATAATLTRAMGDALCARLAILAGLPVGTRTEQIGRLRVRGADAAEVELLVAIRSAPGGLIAELRRVVGVEGEAAAGSSTSEEEVGGVLRAVGPYRILGELGRGGMGIVYRAEHTVLEKQVAIKLLDRGLASVPEFAARFVLEARAACRARHPGIVDVTDFGWLKSGRAYLVMELVDGETLQTVLRRGPVPVGRAVRLATQVARALSAAAARGIVHRDLKPANIFIAKDGTAKLGDFGVATIQGQEAEARIVGTARYMSPEQAAGETTDTRSDLYSLGCVLFEMLTGRPPFDGPAFTDILQKQATAPVPALVSPEGPVPELLEGIVRRAMAKRPEDRFQTADEVALELERVGQRSDWRQWLPR
jgi:serine/threonine-protein kinase